VSDTKKKPLTARYRDELLAEVDRLRYRAALRWTDEVKPDLPPPKSGEKHTEGFVAYMWGTDLHLRLNRACSSSWAHGTCEMDRRPSTSSQNPLAISSTVVHALRVLRCQKEREFGEALARIDAAIAAEVAKGAEEGEALREALS